MANLNKKINDQMRDAGIPRKLRGLKFPIFLANEISLLMREEMKKAISHLANGYKFSGGRLEKWNESTEEYQYIEFDSNLTIEDQTEITTKIEKLGFTAQITIGNLFLWIGERDCNEQGFSASCSGRGIEYDLEGVNIHIEEEGGFYYSKVTNINNFNLNEKIEVRFVGFAGSEVFKSETEFFFGIKFPNIKTWK